MKKVLFIAGVAALVIGVIVWLVFFPPSGSSNNSAANGFAVQKHTVQGMTYELYASVQPLDFSKAISLTVPQPSVAGYVYHFFNPNQCICFATSGTPGSMDCSHGVTATPGQEFVFACQAPIQPGEAQAEFYLEVVYPTSATAPATDALATDVPATEAPVTP